MYMAQQLEIKGDVSLESVGTDSGSGYFPSTGGDTGYYPPPSQSTYSGDTGYCPPPPDSTFGGDTGYCPPPPQTTFGGDTGYYPPQPQPTFGGDTGYCPPPPQSTFGVDFNTGFGYPSAPTAFPVRIIIFFKTILISIF